MKYLTIDASLHGTGIRDSYEGGYIEPKDLCLNSEIIKQLNEWLIKYENEHYKGYSNQNLINDLDNEGKEIALKIKQKLLEAKIEYFPAAQSLLTLSIIYQKPARLSWLIIIIIPGSPRDPYQFVENGKVLPPLRKVS